MSDLLKNVESLIQQKDLYAIPIDDFFKSAFSVDCVIFGYHDCQLKVLLIERGTQPYENYWALPGDLVYPNEDLDFAASRVLKDLTSLPDISIRQVKTFGKVNRHPLGRVITVAYTTLVETTELNPIASSWAKSTAWHSLKEIPQLAFDHMDILMEARKELNSIVIAEALWSKVLPPKFTLTQLQEVFETLLDKKLDKGNFRKKIQEYRFLVKLEESQKNVNHRPSQLYSFDQIQFNQSNIKGFNFEM
jgi:8-oxo-dGTP diphosphatase